VGRRAAAADKWTTRGRVADGGPLGRPLFGTGGCGLLGPVTMPLLFKLNFKLIRV
jgi:hypothetical protein